MVHTLRALRNSPELLLNTMDVFVKEPALDWKVCTWEFRKVLCFFFVVVCLFVCFCLYHIISSPTSLVVSFMLVIH